MHMQALNKMEAQCTDIFQRFMQFTIKESPEFATYKGLDDTNNDKLDSFDLSAYERRKSMCVRSKYENIQDIVDDSRLAFYSFYSGLLEEMKHIKKESLTRSNSISLEVLKYSLQTAVKGLMYKSHLVPWTIWEGVDMYMTSYVIPRARFETEKDYKDYIARLRAYPKQVGEIIGLLKEGLKQGIVGHSFLFGEGSHSVLGRLQKIIDCPLEDLVHFKPFLAIPNSFNEELRVAFKRTGRELMKSCVQQPLEEAKSFLVKEYIPHMPVDLIPGPHDRYQAYLHYFCDTDISPEELHKIGVKEVNRLKAKLYKVMEILNFKGSPAEFVKSMLENQDLHFSNLDDIKPHCQNVIDNVIRPKLEQLFFKPKDIPLKITAIHANLPSRGIYSAPPLDGSKPGILKLWINSGFARFEVIPLMLHETEPGHHFQACAIQANTSLPLFRNLKDDRRYFESPGRTPLFSAYTEGWGLYCEDLGHELGLYDDPYDEYGYLVHSFTRAVRIVADTGINGFGWSSEDVKQYLDENAPIVKREIMSEIPRYVTTPGQACSYTYGMLQIQAFRAKAESELGSLFDVRQFHQECLDCGPVPLPVLEKIIDDYIQQTKDANAANET